MTYYIFPEEVGKFSHKIDLASKHLTRKPKVTFSEPMLKKQVTFTEINNGWEGRYRSVKTLELVQVDIEDIEDEGWTLVADVHYPEGLINMISSTYFKDMPKEFGLSYTRCDYCGHRTRKQAFVLYNKETGEWKQVGTTCVSKMLGSSYLLNFSISLSKFESIFICSSCEDTFFSLAGSKCPSRMGEALNIADILTAVREFRKNFPEWKKNSWDSRGYNNHDGYTYVLNDWLDSNIIESDNGYVSNITDFVATLPDGEFNDNIKRAFKDEWIARHEIYTVFFACKAYESKVNGIEEKLEKYNNTQEHFRFEKLKLIHIEKIEGYYGISYLHKFRNSEGLTILKDFSSRVTAYDFKNDDETYSFTGKVKYIDKRKQAIILGGRLKK